MEIPEGYSEESWLAFLHEWAFLYPKWIDGVGWCALQRMIFTVAVWHGIGPVTMGGRFCFDSIFSAANFYLDWDGKTLPVVGVDGCKAIKSPLDPNYGQ